MVEQRSNQWFEKRKGRVTASNAGAALGLVTWKTPDQLIRDMVREHHGLEKEFISNIATDWGVQHERAALLAFMRETGLDVEDCGFFPYEDWSGASPDGITDDDAVLEIKVPFSLRNGGEFKPLAEQPHYLAQVMLEMISSEKKRAYFYQYVPGQGDIFNPGYVPAKSMLEEIYLDQQWIDENIPKLRLFYGRYLDELNNPIHLEELRVVIDSNEAKSVVNRIGELDEGLFAMAEERKHLLNKLVEMSQGKNAEIFGRKLTLVEKKGSISYSKAISDLLPDADLDKYIGKPSSYWRLS